MRNSLFYILFISLFAISDDGCEVSKWGKDDEIGAANLISNAIKAGIGNHVEGIVGAEVDSRYSPPIRIKGVVHSLKKGDRNAEYEAVIKVNNVFVIVTKKRKPYIIYYCNLL